MVQGKEPNKVLIHTDNVELQQSSQHQNGIITSGDDMNKSRSVQLSRRSFSKPIRKSSPSHVPITTKSPQKQQPLMRTDRSPHYMKPTGSSDAKKEIFPVSLSDSQYDHDYKGHQPKFSNNWKARVVPGKQPAKTFTRSSSLKLSRTLTQSPNFKSSRSSPRKSCKIAVCADMNSQSSLSPESPKANPQVSESETTSVRKACRYTFCSLNGHHRRSPLPPLKSFLSKRRRLLKAQKTMKQEEQSLQRLKVPFKTKVSDTEQIVIDGNSACNEAEVDFFIEIYANEKKHEAKPTATGHGHDMRKLESSEEFQDQEVIKFMIEGNILAAREDHIKQITTSMSPELESNSKKDLKKYYDDTVTKEETILSLHQEQNEESADENILPSCSHENVSMEICGRRIGINEKEHLRSSEMGGYDFEATDTEGRKRNFCNSKLEEIVVFPVPKKEMKFELESSSESLLEAPAESDKILSTTRLEEIKCLVEEAPQEAKAQECACFEAQPREKVLDLKVTSECIETRSLIDNGGKNEISLQNYFSCIANVLNVGTPMSPSDQIYIPSVEECKLNQVERERDKGSKNLEMKYTETNQDFAKQVESNGYGRQVHQISKLYKIDEINEGIDSSPETEDGSISKATQILLKDVHSENIFIAQDKEMLEANESGDSKFQGTCCTGTEENKRSKNWREEMKHKIPVKEDEQLRKLNQRKPDFLPLNPNPEREKVILKHQIMDERKSSEQWMLDHALRQAVTKLAQVRKSKVALLIEAFETVMPVTQK